MVLIVYLLVRHGREFFRIGKRDLMLCALVGTLGLSGSNFFYYLAIQKATVAIAITLQYTAPVWVLLTMVLAGRERASLRPTMAVLLALAGIALTIGLFYSDIKLSLLGLTAALVASFSFSFYNIVGQYLVGRNHQLRVMAYALLGATLMWLAIDPPWKLAALHMSAGEWIFLFVFACVSMLLPYSLYFTGLKYLDPTRAVITSCLEPVFAIVFAVIFVHEQLRSVQVLGILIVLAATVMVQVRRGPQ
jgi:drug/metabolite transporter (DMT)-like permease